MIYSVNIYSNFNALIFQNSTFIKEINLKNGLHIKVNTEKENTFLIYSSQTFLGYKFLPYAININEILQKNNCKLAKLKNYVGLNENVCEIELKENLIVDYIQEKIKCVNLTFNKKEYYVEVFNSYISINNFKFFLKNRFSFNTCSVQLKNNFIFVIYKNDFCYYSMIFNISEIIVLEYENICYKFEIDEKNNCVKILTKHNSFYKTGIVTKYKISDSFDELEHYFVKLGSFNSNLNENLIPFAFMQCVILKDYNLAKNFLCSELSSKLNSNTLSTYFSNLEECEKCKYCEDNSTLFVKYKGEANYKPLKFVMRDKKIIDIK